MNDEDKQDVTVGPSALPTVHEHFNSLGIIEGPMYDEHFNSLGTQPMTAFEHFLSLIARDNPSLHSKITSD